MKHFGVIAAELPAPIAKTAYGELRMTERADLLTDRVAFHLAICDW
ncbi:hypothetical protein [Paenibacillus chungangensis]